MLLCIVSVQLRTSIELAHELHKIVNIRRWRRERCGVDRILSSVNMYMYIFQATVPNIPDVIFICILSPWCTLPLLILTMTLMGIFKVVLPSIRDLKRIESSSEYCCMHCAYQCSSYKGTSYSVMDSCTAQVYKLC